MEQAKKGKGTRVFGIGWRGGAGEEPLSSEGRASEKKVETHKRIISKEGG